ncbi:MAG: glutamine synthetase [Halobacteriovoraceae bacterium]|nr:glutamine synthetase [Halobacteriovoraceae bacterium]
MKLSKQQVIDEVNSYPGQKVKFAVTDIDGVLRGKVIHKDKFISALEGNTGFCDVVFGWDMNDRCYDIDLKLTGWHSGYPDAIAQIDINTFRTIPWDNDIPFVLGDFRKNDGSHHDICPRSVLKKVNKVVTDSGYNSIFSQEFEWFNFEEDSESLHERGFYKPNPITQGMFGYSILRSSQNNLFFNDLFDLLLKFNIPLEGLHTETGPGVYEAAIIYDDIIEAADKAVLFKTSVKEIAHKHGIIPTFMAKWSDDYPGCGGHLHQSLWKNGKNVFFDENSPKKMSKIMRSYIAGQLKLLPYVLPMYAPTINSYKRLVEGAWAPTTITWAIDNRTVAIRALPGNSKSTRIEMRVPGSDVNPYLAMAASLATGFYGVKNNLDLEVEETIGNGYKNFSNGTLPKSLTEASELMNSSEIARDLFGDAFVDHFTATRLWEAKQAASSVTDWELKRYFEII